MSKTNPSIDAIEVDEEEQATPSERAKLLGTTTAQLRKEKRDQKMKEEFWSDPCWTEPL